MTCDSQTRKYVQIGTCKVGSANLRLRIKCSTNLVNDVDLCFLKNQNLEKKCVQVTMVDKTYVFVDG